MTEPQVFETKDLPRAAQPAPVPHMDALTVSGQPAPVAAEPAADSDESTKSSSSSTRAKRSTTSDQS